MTAGKRKGWMTADEVLAELSTDRSYQEMMAKKNREHERAVEDNRRAAAPLLADLEAVGYVLGSVSSLRSFGRPYPRAIPVLIRWLPKMDNLEIKQSIIQSLAVRGARGTGAAQALVAEFRTLEGERDSDVRWSIGGALEQISDPVVFDDMVAIATDPSWGRSREFVVSGLGRLKDTRAVAPLRKLLEDEQVMPQAVQALGELRAQEARPDLEQLLNHPDKLVQKAVRRALKRLA